MHRTLECLTVMMSGVIMASVLRYHGFDQLWPSGIGTAPPWSLSMMYNNAVVFVAVWAPMAVCLSLLASLRFRSSVSHVTCWWWIVAGRLCIIVCNAWIAANEHRATALNVSVWLQYVFVGCWYGIGGWLPAVAYWLLSISSMSDSVVHIVSLLASTRALIELQSIGTTTMLYFGALASFHALENWRNAYRVWLGVGSFLCALSIVVNAYGDSLRHYAHGVMSYRDFGIAMHMFHNEALMVAACAFAFSFVGRCVDNAIDSAVD